MTKSALRPREITEIEIISTARDIITSESHWTQKAFARNAAGKSISWEEPSAVCFCLLGALSKSARLLSAPSGVHMSAINELAIVAGCDVNVFNDTKPHIEVLQLLDYTMERLEGG